jgi:hypothetical protein
MELKRSVWRRLLGALLYVMETRARLYRPTSTPKLKP